MPNATADRPIPTPLANLSSGTEPLSRSYDPPVRGALLVASAGEGKTDAAFVIAERIAERLGVGVEVVAVLEPYPVLLLGAEPAVFPPDFEQLRESVLRDAVMRRLRALGAKAEQWPVAVFYGDPAKTLAKVARDRDATMMVIGLGKRGILHRLPGGERALHAVRAADRPVLAVAADSVTSPRMAVVGMDFSPASVRAARMALLMLPQGGVLSLVHVRAPLDLPALRYTSEMSNRSYESLVEQYRIKADTEAARLFTRLRDELGPYAPHGVTIATQTRTGSVLEQLLAAADEQGAHLLAVGTHGPGVLERFFVGSVATEVLRHSSRSVLVAPSPNAAEAARLTLRLQGTADLVKVDDWAGVLDKFSVRNDGRRVRLEVDDPDVGAQLQQLGFALLGVVYDHQDKRIDIMMGDPEKRTRHLTRSIPAVDDVAIFAEPNGAERALRILSGRSQTLITFTD